VAKIYEIQQGDYLAKIASDHGLASWQTIYNAPGNAELRALRPNPNVLQPGDRVLIPDVAATTFSIGTGAVHTFMLKRPPVGLRILVRDADGQPLPLRKYQLEIDGKVRTRRRDSAPEVAGFDPRNLVAGLIHEQLDSPATKGSLKLWLTDENATEPDHAYDLDIGHLDPVSSASGLQARLNNLGFVCGEVDGQLGGRTEHAVRAFQQHHELEVTGRADDRTMKLLVDLHGS